MKQMIRNTTILFLFFGACTASFAQNEDTLEKIANELIQYQNYQSYCYYTFSFPFGDPMSIESNITVKKIPADTLCGFYYQFETNKNYRKEFGDFSMYFNNAVYISYKGKVKKTSLYEEPEAFQKQIIGNNIRPAIQRAPQLFNITPYQIATVVYDMLEDTNSNIIQKPDTIIDSNMCLRYILATLKTTTPVDSSDMDIITQKITLELCFDKSTLHPVYYKKDIKSSFIDSFQSAKFTNTTTNSEMLTTYFSEENLLPQNWQIVNQQEKTQRPGDLAGKAAPDWDLPILNKDEKLSNKSLLGKYVLLEFTATWCGPCMVASEMMNRLDEKFKDNENISVISIFSSDIDNEEGISRFAEKFNLRSTILYSASQIGKQYNIFSYPNFIIISPKGTILMNFPGYNTTVENNITNVLSELAG